MTSKLWSFNEKLGLYEKERLRKLKNTPTWYIDNNQECMKDEAKYPIFIEISCFQSYVGQKDGWTDA